ncbi:Hypothetical predicted protein [Paramuricea clavata]|uniref:Uncharacterized protein n=1 Tax=Paramuricea clavata TaxID=317549 RepID=A0A7D9K5W1_PARCT|nr:Hypothetical predicted protein [Paramuricea clavata]
MSKQSEMILKSGSKVRNIEGTADCEALGFDSWKKYYKGAGGKKRKWPARCRISDCNREATDGAHVECKRRSGEWIIPMCSKHNNPSNEKWMSVKRSSTVVRAVDTC